MIPFASRVRGALLFALCGLAAISTVARAAPPTVAWQSNAITTPPFTLDSPGGDISNTGRRSAVDSAGNLYVAATTFAASSGACMNLLKFASSDGHLDWNREICSAADDTFSGAVAVDADGNVFLTGALHGDFYLAKLAPDSAALWERTIPRSGTHSFAGVDVGLDGAGNPRVATMQQGVITVHAYRGSDGTHLWERSLDNAFCCGKLQGRIAVDASGGVALADRRQTDVNENVADIVSRIGSDGTLLWQKQLTGFQSHLAILPDGAVISAGVSGIYRLDAITGDVVWNTAFNGILRGDAQGNLYGSAYNAVSTDNDPNLSRYRAADGGVAWSQSIVDNTTNAVQDSIALDPAGNPILMSRVFDNASGSDREVTIKFDAATGNLLWTATDENPTIALSGRDVHAGPGFTIAFGLAQRRSDRQIVGLRAVKYIDAASPPAPAQLTINPPSIDFGLQSAGTPSADVNVSISNTGGTSATIQGIAVSMSAFSQTNNCGTLAPAAFCTVRVTFTPPAMGGQLNSTTPFSGSLMISSDAPGSPHTVALTGTGEQSLVTQYYRLILGRDPDPAGHDFWQSEAARLDALGADLNEAWYAMALAFFASSEYNAQPRDNPAFVRLLYRVFLARLPDEEGLEYWKSQLAMGLPRDVALVSFMLSPEFRAFSESVFGAPHVRAETLALMDFYRGLLGRLPDDDGYRFWLQRLRSAQCRGADALRAEIDSMTREFTTSPEHLGRGRTSTQYVADMYDTFLRRGGDREGVLYWIAKLDDGSATREQLRQAFLMSSEFTARVDAVIAEGCMP